MTYPFREEVLEKQLTLPPDLNKHQVKKSSASPLADNVVLQFIMLIFILVIGFGMLQLFCSGVKTPAVKGGADDGSSNTVAARR